MSSAIALTLLAVTAQTLGNFALSLGLKRHRLWFLPAITLLAVHFFSWCQALKLAALAVLVPLTAFSHVLNAALAGPLLGERVGKQRWLGTALIVVGILLVVL